MLAPDEPPPQGLTDLLQQVFQRHRELLAVRSLQRRFRARRAGGAGSAVSKDNDGKWTKLRLSAMPLVAMMANGPAAGKRTALRLHTKFETAGNNFTFGFAGIQLYYQGLEHFIGSPQPDVMGAMDREHSSAEPFSSHNVFETTPRAEWLYITAMEVGAIESRAQDATPGRIGWRLADFVACKEAQEAQLLYVEVLAVRLYTGPMYVHYNGLLRAAEKTGDYVTTIHMINSAIVKLGKRTRPMTVYRGVLGGVLPRNFFEPDEFGVMGGVETGCACASALQACHAPWPAHGAIPSPPEAFSFGSRPRSHVNHDRMASGARVCYARDHERVDQGLNALSDQDGDG